MSITGAKVESAIKADPYFRAQGEQAVAFGTTIGKYLLKVFAKHMDEQITLKLFLQHEFRT